MVVPGVSMVSSGHRSLIGMNENSEPWRVHWNLPNEGMPRVSSNGLVIWGWFMSRR